MPYGFDMYSLMFPKYALWLCYVFIDASLCIFTLNIPHFHTTIRTHHEILVKVVIFISLMTLSLIRCRVPVALFLEGYRAAILVEMTMVLLLVATVLVGKITMVKHAMVYFQTTLLATMEMSLYEIVL